MSGSAGRAICWKRQLNVYMGLIFLKDWTRTTEFISDDGRDSKHWRQHASWYHVSTEKMGSTPNVELLGSFLSSTIYFRICARLKKPVVFQNFHQTLPQVLWDVAVFQDYLRTLPEDMAVCEDCHQRVSNWWLSLNIVVKDCPKFFSSDGCSENSRKTFNSFSSAQGLRKAPVRDTTLWFLSGVGCSKWKYFFHTADRPHSSIHAPEMCKIQVLARDSIIFGAPEPPLLSLRTYRTGKIHFANRTFECVQGHRLPRCP